MAGKPLLSVGVSDIGIEGDKVEANLQKIFDLAGKWEAVLLLQVVAPDLPRFYTNCLLATKQMSSSRHVVKVKTI